MTGIKKYFGPIDMLTGEPWEKILAFSVPMLIGNVVQQLYNTVDSIVVGKFVGDNALAAVGSAGPILNLLIALFVGVSMGSSIVVSQYLGAKKREELSYSIGNSIFLTMAVTVIVMVLALLLVKPLLLLLNTPASIMEWSAEYLRILFIGAAGMSFYNIMSGVLRGLGDSVSALIYLIIACILNIFLDLAFVIFFHMGVAGVAWATIIAQGISAMLCVWKLFRMTDMFDLKGGYMKPKKEYLSKIVQLGAPSGITQAIFSMAMLLVQSLVNGYGEQFIAANVIVMRVDGFAMLPNFSFGTAMTTYTGQNFGARKYDRIETGARQGTIMAVISAATITALILIFGRGLMSIFTNTDTLVETSMRMMRILSVGYVAMGIVQSLSGVMRGAGDTITPMWISVIMTVGLRLPIAYGLAYLTRSADYPKGRPESVFISLLIAWLLGALLNYICYRRSKKKILGRMQRQSDPVL